MARRGTVRHGMEGGMNDDQTEEKWIKPIPAEPRQKEIITRRVYI